MKNKISGEKISSIKHSQVESVSVVVDLEIWKKLISFFFSYHFFVVVEIIEAV